MTARLEIKEVDVAKNIIDTLVLNGYKVWCKHLYGLSVYNIFFEIDDDAIFKTEDKQDDIQKIQQKYINNDDEGCESCVYKTNREYEDPCKSCCHNYINHWRLNKTAD